MKKRVSKNAIGWVDKRVSKGRKKECERGSVVGDKMIFTKLVHYA